MKKILSILFLLITFYSFGQTPTYSPNRSKGNVIVTDVALRAKDFLQLPYANAASPSIGSYADSTGWVMYNRYDSTIIVRNAGTWFKFYNSIKINAMDALNAHLAGSETFTGAKTFNGNIISAGTTTVGNDIIWNNNTGYGLKGNDGVRFLSYTTSGINIPSGVAAMNIGTPTTHSGTVTNNSTTTLAGATTSNDIAWSNNTGFGLKGSDGVRFVSYTTAGGVVIGTSATPINLKSLTTAGVVLTTSAGVISSISKLTSANIDTGNVSTQVATAGNVKKKIDSLGLLIPSGPLGYKYNTGTTTVTADANYSVSDNTTIVQLTATLTANRTLTLPTPSSYLGQTIMVWNRNSSGFTWQFAGNVVDATNTTITNLANGTIYYLYSNNTSWVKIN